MYLYIVCSLKWFVDLLVCTVPFKNVNRSGFTFYYTYAWKTYEYETCPGEF